MKKILVPCDFSVTAKEAYTFALNLAGIADAEIVVLNVIDFPIMYEAPYAQVAYVDPNVIEKIEKEARKNYESMKAGHARKEKVKLQLVHGAVTTGILNAIEEWDVDLVVMGTNGSTKGLEEYFIGSNTEKIVRFSPVPVFAIRRAVSVDRIQNIVVPTDLALNQTNLIAHIKELQVWFNARLHILLVNTPSNLKKTSDRMAELTDFAKKYDLVNYTLNLRDDFSEDVAIIEFSKEIKADMIAMGTHGRRGLSHLFMGSIAEDVVNHGSCPIWTFSTRKK